MTPLRNLLDLAEASVDAIGAALADVPGYLTPNHDAHRLAVLLQAADYGPVLGAARIG